MDQRRRHIPISAGFALFVAACTVPPEDVPDFKPGASVSQVVDVGGKRVPLPPGTWTIAAVERQVTAQGNRTLMLFLIDLESGSDLQAVRIHTNIRAGRGDWLASPICRRTDLLHLATRFDSVLESRECWAVHHAAVDGRHDDFGASRRAADFARSKGAAVPGTVLVVWFGLADRQGFLDVSYLFNPERLGFGDLDTSQGRDGSWDVRRVGLGSRRAEYVERLKTWGADWLSKVTAGFGG